MSLVTEQTLSREAKEAGNDIGKKTIWVGRKKQCLSRSDFCSLKARSCINSHRPSSLECLPASG